MPTCGTRPSNRSSATPRSGRTSAARSSLARATGLGVDLGDELVAIVITEAEEVGEQAGRFHSGVGTASARGFPPNAMAQRRRIDVGPDPGSRFRDAEGRHEDEADGAHRRVWTTTERPPAASASAGPRARRCSAVHMPRLRPPTSWVRRRPKGDVYHYTELVLHRLLDPLAKAGPQLANFVESELGELIAYDDEHRSDLLNTLTCTCRTTAAKRPPPRRSISSDGRSTTGWTRSRSCSGARSIPQTIASGCTSRSAPGRFWRPARSALPSASAT